MSWEAVTWASKQRMKLPHEQLILLVLANCADPNGEAFAKWPGREHWWKYLADRTRLSKSSLFRHINTLIELGLCTRSMMVLEDGTRRPTIRLDLEKSFDIEEFDEAHSHQRDQSHGETGGEESFEDAENTSDDSDFQAEITAPPVQSHGETSPTGETEPFPIVGMHKDSITCSKENPPTPQGGLLAVDDGFEEFRKAWREPMQRMALVRSVWDGLPTARRGEAITAARGYFAWIAAQRKPPTVVSAQTFLRDAVGWTQWLRYAPQADGAQPSVSATYARESREGVAISVLYEIAGKGDFLRQFMLRNNAINYPLPITPRLLALADAPPRSQWVTLDRQQAGAWDGLLSEAVHVQVRSHLREGSCAPWPWPPRKGGTLSPTGPPETLMSDDDLENFK